LLGLALAFGLVCIVEGWALSQESTWMPSPLQARVRPIADASQTHPFLLWEEIPGVRQMDGSEVHINTMGMRGVEVARQKPARERRLMILGDDIGFGRGVEAHEVFGQVAVDELGGARVGLRSVNAAVPGYSTLQQLNLMELRGWALDPDVLVVVDGPSDRSVDSFVDEEVVPPARLSGVLGMLQDQFASVRLMDFYLGVGQGRQLRRYRKIVQGEVEGNPQQRARMGPNARSRALRRLVERAQELGVGLVFVLTALPGDLTDEVSADLQVHRRIVRDLAQWSGSKVVEGGEVFRKTGRPASELWQDDLHPTVLGHRLLGRALAKTLARWIRGGAPGGGARGGVLPDYEVSVEEGE